MSSSRSHIDLSKIGFEIRIPHHEVPVENIGAKENTRSRQQADDEAMLAALTQQQHLEDWETEEEKLAEYSTSLPAAAIEEPERIHNLLEGPVEDYQKMSCRTSSYLTFDSDCYLPEEGEDDDNGNDGATTSSSKIIQVDLGYEDVIVPSRSHGDIDDSCSLHTRLSSGKPIRNKRSSALRRASQCSGMSKMGSQCSGKSLRASQCSGRSSGHRRRAQRTISKDSICSSTSSFLREDDDRGAKPQRLSVASHSSLRQRPGATCTNNRKVGSGNSGNSGLRDSSIGGRSMEDDIAQACKELEDLAIDDADDLSASRASSHQQRRSRRTSLTPQGTALLSRSGNHDSTSSNSSAFSPVPETGPTRQTSLNHLSIRTSNMLLRALTHETPISRVTRQSTTSRRASDCGVHNRQMLSGSARTNSSLAGVANSKETDTKREMDAIKDQFPSPTCPRKQLQASVDSDKTW